jgi:hypothetical protein
MKKWFLDNKTCNLDHVDIPANARNLNARRRYPTSSQFVWDTVSDHYSWRVLRTSKLHSNTVRRERRKEETGGALSVPRTQLIFAKLDHDEALGLADRKRKVDVREEYFVSLLSDVQILPP